MHEWFLAGATVLCLLTASLVDAASFERQTRGEVPSALDLGAAKGQVTLAALSTVSYAEAEERGWFDPRTHGGRMLDFASPDKGEPLNIIISSNSDPFILTDSGFQLYANSVGFSEECLGLHYGYVHRANLGDGDGEKDEEILARQVYFPVWGTCWESVAGGHHFRAWKQDGPSAHSGAWFIGASKEKDSGQNHMIVDNGYNIGRDYFVKKAVRGTHWKSMWWRAEVEWNENDLLRPGHEGVNHGIDQDGRVAILTVHRV